MTFSVGSKVASIEHPNSVGEVLRINVDGDLTVQFTTQPRVGLPFGHICTEFWPASDAAALVIA